MSCFAAVDNDAAARYRTGLPVILAVAVPCRSRRVFAGSDCSTVCNECSTAKALGVAGIAVNLILVIGFSCIYSSSAAGMMIRV